MKPSERRAMKEQKNNLSEEPKTETESGASESRTSFEDDYVIEKNSYGETVSDSREESPRREGFVQSHIRLITFIVCIGVFLALFGPWSYFKIKDIIESSNRIENGLTDITMMNVYGISEKGEGITWADFSNYNYEDQSYDHENGRYIRRQYNIKDSKFFIWVGGSTSQGIPDYVYLINGDTGSRIDMREESAKDFVEGGIEETDRN